MAAVSINLPEKGFESDIESDVIPELKMRKSKAVAFLPQDQEREDSGGQFWEEVDSIPKEECSS